jgi:hypothetical protein
MASRILNSARSFLAAPALAQTGPCAGSVPDLSDGFRLRKPHGRAADCRPYSRLPRIRSGPKGPTWRPSDHPQRAMRLLHSPGSAEPDAMMVAGVSTRACPQRFPTPLRASSKNRPFCPICSTSQSTNASLYWGEENCGR